MVFLRVNEAIYNLDSEHTLLSVFQIRQFKIELDMTPKMHGVTQKMIVEDGVEIPLMLKQCMIYFPHRELDEQEMQEMQNDESLLIHITQGGVTWEPHRCNEDNS